LTQDAHRCFTAKNAKNAKNIAKDIACLAHRTIAVFFWSFPKDMRPHPPMSAEMAICDGFIAMGIAVIAFFAFQSTG
jgi:hypothetical protein